MCIRCAEVLPMEHVEAHGAICGECAREAPHFERAVAFGSYDNELRSLIHLLKYEHVRPAAKVLGRLAASSARELYEEFDKEVVVVAVPLHKEKRFSRGFNQAEEIAKSLTRELGKDSPVRLKFAPSVLIRKRRTESQVGMSREQRKANLRGAFVVLRDDEIRGKDVLLVDDVLTTGATVGECARVLLRKGASRVFVATAARTIKLSVVSASYLHGEEELAATGQFDSPHRIPTRLGYDSTV